MGKAVPVLVLICGSLFLVPAPTLAGKPPLIFPFAPTEAWTISTGYGGSATHQSKDYYAVDFTIPGDGDRGLPILAAASGTVSLIGDDDDGYGHYVVIDHGEDYYTLYAHFDEAPTLQEGDPVTQGRTIGRCGDSGNSNGVHLHFAMYRKVDDVLTAEIPEPMCGYTDLQEGEYFGISSTPVAAAPPQPPYYPGESLSAQFTITNLGDRDLAVEALSITGRGPGGPADVQDFPLDNSVPALATDQSHEYSNGYSPYRGGLFHFRTAFMIGGNWYSIPTSEGCQNKLDILVSENLAYNKPVFLATNGAEGYSDGHPGEWPQDAVDGSLSYSPVSSGSEDGCLGWQNPDYDELLRINVVIDLGQQADVTRVRYNMGNCLRSDSWNADRFVSYLGSSGTNPGSSYLGAWTDHYGFFTGHYMQCIFEKTRVSFETDWLFIGEIEVYGTARGGQDVVSATILGSNNQFADPVRAVGSPDNEFVSLGVGGEIVLDLGETIPDQSGDDIIVVTIPEPAAVATDQEAEFDIEETYAVSGSNDNVSWINIGPGTGTQTFDMASAGMTGIRYVKVIDGGAGDSLSSRPGVDLDAVSHQWSDPLTDADVAMPGITPHLIELRSIHPNPFNPRTIIRFSVSRPSRVYMGIYSVQGSLVRTILDGQIAEGEHTATWDGRNGRGKPVSSGVYFVWFTAGFERVSEKIVLTR